MLVWSITSSHLYRCVCNLQVQYLNTEDVLIQNLTLHNSITLSDLKPHRNYTFTVVVRSGTESQVLRRSLPVSAIFTTMESVPGKVRRTHDWTVLNVGQYKQIWRFHTVVLYFWIFIHSSLTIKNWTHVRWHLWLWMTSRIRSWDKVTRQSIHKFKGTAVEEHCLPFKFLFSKKLTLLPGWEVSPTRYSAKSHFVWMGITK